MAPICAITQIRNAKSGPEALESHSSGLCGGPVDWAEHLVLPWLTFALLFLALYTRMVRASVAETIHEDYVRTARAKGASEWRILARHVVPSAGLRVLTMVGMEINLAVDLLYAVLDPRVGLVAGPEKMKSLAGGAF